MMLSPDLELVIVTGKGGVGKTTVAAALAWRIARSRRVMLLEVDPRESAHRLFDVPPSGGEPVKAGERLELLHARSRQVVDEIVQDKLKVAPLVRRLQASPIYEHFIDGAPGLKELALLRYAHSLVKGAKRKRRADCVVLDSPATGHALALLSAPVLAAEAIGAGPIAALAREVATWLSAETTGLVLVTLAEELPVTETLEAADALGEVLGKPPEAWIANALYPEVPAQLESNDSVTELWRRRRAVNERELARLARAVGEPVVSLPLLPIDEGSRLVAALSRELEASDE
ncbi:MAG: ArsA family ATPase [bacterium]|nr:ArsA family ATPase [bacterium]